MLHSYLQKVYNIQPITKWWKILSKIKLYILLKGIKKNLKDSIDGISNDEFIDMIPEFCSIILDVGGNGNYKVDRRISVHIIEYIKNFNITYILRIDNVSPTYGEYSIKYSFNTKDSDRVQFRLSLKNKTHNFSFYDGYLEKDITYMISSNIKQPVIDDTKGIIYEAMCVIIDNAVNRFILGKEVDSL